MLHRVVKYSAIVVLLFMDIALCRAVSFTRLPSAQGFPQANISDIAQDSVGDIWISSHDGGVFRYNGSEVEKIDGRIRASGICCDSSGRVFVGTSTRVYLYDKDRGLVRNPTKGGLRDSRETSTGDLFFLTNHSLSVLRAGCDTLVNVPFPDTLRLLSIEYIADKIYVGCSDACLYSVDPSSLEVKEAAHFSRRISCLAARGSDSLWVAESEAGVSCYSVSFNRIVSHIGAEVGLSDSNIQSMCFENDSTLWLGTYKGLDILNINDCSVTVSRCHFFDNSSLPHDSVKVLFKDFQGGMWVGTFFGGVSYYHKSRDRFRTFRQGLDSGYLNDSVVSCICEGPDGTLWIGTNNGGVNAYNKKDGSFEYYKFNVSGEPSEVTSNDVKSFLFMPDNRYVYVGIYRGGLNLLDRNTGHIRRLKFPDSVINMELTDENHILINSYERSYLYSISDSDYYMIPGQKPYYAQFKKSELIPDVLVGSELSARDGETWYATNNGLYKFNMADSSYVHYSTADGAACDFYNPGAACLGNDGTMYFGGVGGVTYFDPFDFSCEESCPEPLIRSIEINESQSVDFSRPIRLKHNQNHIRFRFSVPDYLSAGTNDFEYMLEGFEKEWTSSGKKNTAFYPNIPAGTYTFRMRVSRGHSEWVECGVHPRITVYRPWYSSIVGVLLESMIAVIALYYFFRSQERRKEMEHALALSRLEEKYKADISKLKALKLVNTQLRIDKKAQPVIKDISRQNELFITKAMSIVEANLSNEDFTTEMLAQKLSISRASLHKKIKEATGHSALDFIQKIRYSEACRLLTEGGLPVSEVGYRIGVSSPAYFSASFKKVIGCTPKEFIAKQNLK